MLRATRRWRVIGSLGGLVGLTLLGCRGAGGKASAGEGSADTGAGARASAPDSFRVRFATSAGDFIVEVRRAWAPRGADRFYELVRAGYYDGNRFFRVLPGFVAQFGISGDPAVSARWRGRPIRDDPVRKSNTRGTLAFAAAGPDTRTTQVFVNLTDNSRLDGMGFAPFGEVVDGMAAVDSLYAGYGEGAPRGQGPDQGLIQREGNRYLEDSFPKLDAIDSARVVDSAGDGAAGA
ncbi:MAG: peptidylprolyl isomerase [Candidatus Palauibacterales bacterium]|nr:peptidylprolyl isomerase [Candidatus Palauibacterales bacterium]MDP2530235.1 peptidylprolyl isomerase [Candidatus Palauibacterales bacterium]MDP2583020.1 peptidylprolyl isomerase [Candidatus Palauibacterales bacterium]